MASCQQEPPNIYTETDVLREVEVGSTRTVKAYWELMVAFIRKCRGRMLDSLGDNLLDLCLSLLDVLDFQNCRDPADCAGFSNPQTFGG